MTILNEQRTQDGWDGPVTMLATAPGVSLIHFILTLIQEATQSQELPDLCCHRFMQRIFLLGVRCYNLIVLLRRIFN